jgi:hypothetical protein
MVNRQPQKSKNRIVYHIGNNITLWAFAKLNAHKIKVYVIHKSKL